MNNDLPSRPVDDRPSHRFPPPWSRRQCPPLWTIGAGEEGYADNTTALIFLAGLLGAPVAFILADLFGFGTVATMLAAIGLSVLAVIVAGFFVLGPPGGRLEPSAVGAIRGVLSTPPAEPDLDAKVRPATLADADAMVAIQWKGSGLVLAEGRGYRRFGAFDAAMRVWLTMALASDDWEVLVEVDDGEVVAWAALDKSGAQGPARPGLPPRRRLGRSHEPPR